MSERNQDQRPVYMGTFSKYTKSFESRVAINENEIADLEKKIRIYNRKIDRLSLFTKFFGAAAIIACLTELAILLLTFL